jgi:hypothetical protein
MACHLSADELTGCRQQPSAAAELVDQPVGDDLDAERLAGAKRLAAGNMRYLRIRPAVELVRAPARPV